MTRSEAERFLAGFAAVADADRAARRAAGADPERAVAFARSAIEVANRLGLQGPLRDPLRARGEEAVRETWRRLRQHALG